LKKILLIFLLLPLFMQPAYVQAAAQISIIENHTSFLDSLGYFHVVGEVKNTGDVHTQFNKIIGTFYDSGGEVVATQLTFTIISVLAPGQKSPFDLLLFDIAQSAKVSSYKLFVSCTQAGPLPQGLEIESHSRYLDSINWLHIVGEIKNIASEEATFVKIAATCFDHEGRVVYAGLGFSDPYDLNPGQTAPFEILIESDRASKVATYELQAQSNQYNIIPEFPIIPLIAAVSLVATSMIFRRTRKGRDRGHLIMTEKAFRKIWKEAGNRLNLRIPGRGLDPSYSSILGSWGRKRPE